MQSPDPDIKLQGVRILSDKCKPFLKDFVSSRSVFGSEFEKRVVGILKSNWWNIPDDNVNKIGDPIENISIKRQLQNAQIIYEKMLPSLMDFPPTLVPLLKLFIARKIRDEVSHNNIPRSDDENFIFTTSEEFMRRMIRLGVLDRERAYSPEEATVGFEMQPKGSKKPIVSVTRMDVKEIRDLIKYAGLGWQNDMPFEIVFPPTRTPIVQTLMLSEACNLTGVPISEVGLQISFGGLTNEGNIRALQRIMLAEGRLVSDSEIYLFGDFWNLHSNTKAEINRREPGSGTIMVTPEDSAHPEFKSIGEYRVPINSANFFIFYRGLRGAHNLANAAKATERGEAGYKLTDNEIKRVAILAQLKEGFNQICKEHGLPPIDAKWTKANWKYYGEMMDSGAFGKFFV